MIGKYFIAIGFIHLSIIHHPSSIIIFVSMKKGKKIEVAVRMRPLIYEYEDEGTWNINEDTRKVTSLPRHHSLRPNSHLNEDGTMRRGKSKVELNNIYEFGLDYVFKDHHSNW